MVRRDRIGKGGEGEVWTLADDPTRLVKLYHGPLDPNKARKLDAMVRRAHSELLRFAAWPLDLVCDSEGRVVGFLMPRFDRHEPVYRVYGPASRLKQFPTARFDFLVRVATNLARAVAALHAHCIVIGDLNESNVLVGADATVALIDCDSYQIEEQGFVFTCDVGKPLYLAPELHGVPLRGRERTRNHDAFALAVLIFQLLLLGRHPFAGRFLGQGDMPIEQAIREHRYAYSTDTGATRMAPPPNLPSPAIFGDAIAYYFERAFRPAAGHGRPRALAWVPRLQQLEGRLVLCTQQKGHSFPAGLALCPWCAHALATGFDPFPVPPGPRPPAGTGAALWAQIQAVAPPPAEPKLPSAQAWVPAASLVVSVRRRRRIRTAARGFLVSGLILFLVALGQRQAGPVGPAIVAAMVCWIASCMLVALSHSLCPRPPNQALRDAKARWQMLLARWQQEATRASFDAKLSELAALRDELDTLARDHQRELEKLRQQARQRFQADRLRGFAIAAAQLPGLGPVRRARLASSGITTAADLDPVRLRQVRGLPRAVRDALLDWRLGLVQSLGAPLDPPLDSSAVLALDQRFESRRQEIEARLRAGPAELEACRRAIEQARGQLLGGLEQAWDEWNRLRYLREGPS